MAMAAAAGGRGGGGAGASGQDLKQLIDWLLHHCLAPAAGCHGDAEDAAEAERREPACLSVCLSVLCSWSLT